MKGDERVRVRRRPTAAEVIGLGLVVAAGLALAVRFLVFWPENEWQVDVEVYRAAGQSMLEGRSVYLYRTQTPQLLPQTYPPFAALLAIPLALVPLGVAGWAWTVLQVWLAWWTTGRAFARFLAPWGYHAPLAQGLVTVAVLAMSPVAEGIRFGQVNAIMVALCLADLASPRTRWPRGMLIGLAVATKLTPGVFLVHLAITRQWVVLRNALAAAAGVTLAAFAVQPGASIDYWTRALLDPGRLGPNQGTSNQSVRGLLLRASMPEEVLGPLWLALVAVAAVAGFALARALHRRGDQVAVVAALGLTAVVASPVSWVHHLHWGVVAVAAVLGAGRERRRQFAAGLLTLALWLPLPWWGARALAWGWEPRALWRGLQSGYLVLAVVGLWLLWRLVLRGRAGAPRHESEPASDAGDGGRGQELGRHAVP